MASLILAPLLIAALNPLQASRNAAYVVASLSGVLALGLLLAQPLLAAGYLPGVPMVRMRRWHRWIGSCIIIAVALHIGGLYLTSAPDTIDALLLVSPTPFSVYGVVAMWSIILTALLVATRGRLGLKNTTWQIAHNLLAVIVVIATIVHALMIEGTMGQVSKVLLCMAVIVATGAVVVHLRIIKPLSRRN
ncbi:MAG: ferric reductase-like transmembrane domain-containing protein [Pseudomonadota bacterium]